MEQGYRFIPLSEYIADPCPEPSLSTSTVDTLIRRTPLHAFNEHPRGGNAPGEESERSDIGSAVHSLILGGAPVIYLPSEFTNYRKDAAKEIRDAARAEGAIPLLAGMRDDVEMAAAAARKVLDGFGPGATEVTMCWQTDGAWCRGRADWLSNDGEYDIDVKTVINADPSDFVRRNVYPNAYDVQAGLRSLGHEAIAGKQRKMMWLIVEISAPFAVSIVGVGPGMLDLAQRKVRYAAKLWRRCLDLNAWPGYPTDIHWAEAETYHELDFAYRTGEALP